MKKQKHGIGLVVALEGKPVPPLTVDERAVYETLEQAKSGGPLSAIGLTRLIRKKPGAARPDKKIAAAAERLWAGMLIAKNQDGNYFIY